MKKLLYISILACVFPGCEPKIEVPSPTSGSANFSNYIAVGNSLTAGYTNQGLTAKSQAASIPAILATQFSEVNPIVFKQPDIPGNGSGSLYLHALNLSVSPPLVDIRSRAPDPGWTDPVQGPFNNLGVPGLRVGDINDPTYAAANPFFGRMASSPMQTYLEMVQSVQPTFFTCWLGNNDVLDYASSGGAAGVEGIPGTGAGGITPQSVFEANYEAVIDALSSGGAKGILLGIPDIALAPFFTFLNTNILSLIQSGGLPLPELDVQTAGFLNFVYQLAGYVEEEGGPIFESGVNLPAVLIGSDSITVRRAVINPDGSGDLLLLTFGDKVGQFLTQGLGFINQSDPAKLLILQNSATLAATAQALQAAAIQAATEAQQLQIQAQEAAAEAELLSQAAADSAAAGNQAAADSLQLLAGQKAQEAQQLGDQAMAKAQEAQQLGVQAQATFDDFQATLPEAVPAAKDVANPILTDDVLDVDEQAVVAQRITAFNAFISSVAAGNPNLEFLDMNELLLEVQSGVYVDGVEISGAFITGGAFSLDGIHVTPRGASIAANEIIKAINAYFSAGVPPAIINQFEPVLLP